VFAADLEPVLMGMHGATRHLGKVPQADDAGARARSDLQAKRALLRSALETEDYEEAAALRDTIHSLEVELGAPGARRN
jgi:protein arginine kinase activator